LGNRIRDTMTELEIDDAIREAWDMVHAGAAASPGSDPTPSRCGRAGSRRTDLWRDRLAAVAEHDVTLFVLVRPWWRRLLVTWRFTRTRASVTGKPSHENVI
jgi:hypothetical protein